jgi:5-methylthioadenosine/S-adenosylhomocysteine deaminase
VSPGWTQVFRGRVGQARASAGVLLLALAVAAAAASGVAGCRPARAQSAASAVVVNECASGPNGWIELRNPSGELVELANDPGLCWFVDDSVGWGSPRGLSDANVNHAGGSTTCSGLGRSPTCGALAPGEAVWVKYPFVNAASADACRLLTAPKIGGIGGSCGGLRDTGTGGPTRSTAAGQCFGRQPDGGAWSAGPIACTPGAPNGKCTPGEACDDGNACTTGETFSASCECAGGTPLNGAPCGSGRVCQVGTCTSMPASAGGVILGQGSRGLLLIGTLVTPDDVIDGELLIVGDEIRCVAPSCQGDPAVATASVVQTNGLIFPGLIDIHDHLELAAFDESDWAPDAGDHFTNHTQWTDNKRHRALVDAEQSLSGEGKGARPGIACELAKFGKLKALIAGATSIVGATTLEDRKCYGSLGRTLNQRPNGLSADKVQVALGPPRTSAEADKVCANQDSGRTDAFLLPIADGTDDIARNEFQRLFDVSTVDGCLFSSKTAVVYGTALQDPQLTQMAARAMSLVWTPRSSVFLYGHGVDLSRTADVPAAIERGITVALATDGGAGGSQNILDELRFADLVDNTQWGDILSARALVQMVTKNPAKILGLETSLGTLALGHKADVVVIGGNRARPYEALLEAAPRDVRLVLVGGKALYGDTALRRLAERPSECDTLDICGVSKFACVAQAGGAATDLLNQRYDDVRGKILVGLQKYDEKKVSEWKFSPPAELCKCAPSRADLESARSAN